MDWPSRPWLAFGIVALAVDFVSSLPWLAGQLLPDILFPAAVLALYLLAFASETLTRWERFAARRADRLCHRQPYGGRRLCLGLVALAVAAWPHRRGSICRNPA